jgi:hypothetical protein
MQVDLRKERRQVAHGTFTLVWEERDKESHSLQVEGIDLSASGMSVRSSTELPVGTVVYLQSRTGHPTGYCVVRNCARRYKTFRIGLEFHEETKQSLPSHPTDDIDYYEFLQISPRAEFATIQRIYRFMAGRLHPDNPDTGDPERFLILKRAYEVLSDPHRRAEYDAEYQARETEQNPIFKLGEFVNGIEGEVNRRLGVLSLLYNRRRTNSENPSISMFDLEKRMGFPREYLDFTIWYLRAKQYITMADSAEITLTAGGVDYVESNAAEIPMLSKLLQSGPRRATEPGPAGRPSGILDEKLIAGPASSPIAEPNGRK